MGSDHLNISRSLGHQLLALQKQFGLYKSLRSYESILDIEVFDLAKNKGKKYECVKCGAVVVYDSDCSCTVCDVVCCGTPMKPKK